MVLRTVFSDNYQVNTDLGGEYHKIDKESCPEKYNECAKECFGENMKDYVDQCYAFIVNRLGSNTIPLYTGHENYILNDKGELFDNLTYK